LIDDALSVLFVTPHLIEESFSLQIKKYVSDLIVDRTTTFRRKELGITTVLLSVE